MERKLPTIGMGSVIVACIIVVLGTTMIPAFAAGTANPTTAEQDGNGSATNCCCAAGGDGVVDIDGDNNTVKIVIDGDSGAVEDVAVDGTDESDRNGDAGPDESAGTDGSNADEDTDTDGESGGAGIDVSVEDGDVRVNGRDVADEDGDGMDNEETKRVITRIVNNVGDTTVDKRDVARIIDENDINGGDTDGINIEALVEALNAANDSGDENAGTPAGDEGGNDAETGDNSQTVGDIDDSTVLLYLLDQDFVDQSELRAAIENNSVDNSTILANIVNGDQTINLNSRYVDNSVTIDNSTTITQVIENSTVVTDSTVDNSSVGGNDDNDGDGNGDGDTTTETTTAGTATTGTTTTGTTTSGTTTGTTTTGTTTTGTTTTGTTTTGGGGATDISVTKTAGNAVLDPDADANVTVDFTVTVTNNGDTTAEDVVVRDEMPLLSETDLADLETSAILLVNSNSADGSYDAGTGNFTIGSLAPGESADLTLTAAVVQVGDSEVDNTATLLTDDTTPDDNVGTVEFDTLVGVITEPIADSFEATLGPILDPVLDALGIDDLTDYLQEQVLAGNVDLGTLIDDLDGGPQAIIDLLERLTGNDYNGGLGPLSADSANVSNSATVHTSTTANQSATTQSAHGPLSAGGLAVGGLASIGLLGSVVLFRRNR